jgi:hypothetical protein
MDTFNYNNQESVDKLKSILIADFNDYIPTQKKMSKKATIEHINTTFEEPFTSLYIGNMNITKYNKMIEEAKKDLPTFKEAKEINEKIHPQLKPYSYIPESELYFSYIPLLPPDANDNKSLEMNFREWVEKKGSGRKKVMKKKKKGGASTEQIGRASAYRTFSEYGKPTYKLLSDIVHSADVGYYNDSGKYVRANQSLFRDYNLKHDDDVEEILDTMYPSYMNQLFYSFLPSKKGFIRPDVRNFVRELMKADNEDPNDEELLKTYLQTIRDSIIEEYKDAPKGIPTNQRWGANNRTVNKYISQYV